VIDAASRELIADLIRNDSCSLLQYTAEAFPWATPENQPAVARVRELALEEQEGIGRLARFLRRNRLPLPVSASYPSEYTTLNFVALDHLLPSLAREVQKSAAHLEARLVYLPKGDARTLLEEYLQLKRRHQQVLAELTVPAQSVLT
jgi:hypothetical protein